MVLEENYFVFSSVCLTERGLNGINKMTTLGMDVDVLFCRPFYPNNII